MDVLPPPRYLYKIVPSSSRVPEPLPERLPVSLMDQRSGFIHLSTAHQIPNTLKYFFRDEPLVYILRIEYDRVEQDIRWEDPDGQVCGPRAGEGQFPVSYSCPTTSLLHGYLERFFISEGSGFHNQKVVRTNLVYPASIQRVEVGSE